MAAAGGVQPLRNTPDRLFGWCRACTATDKKRKYAEDPVYAAATRGRANARRARAKALAVIPPGELAAIAQARVAAVRARVQAQRAREAAFSAWIHGKGPAPDPLCDPAGRLTGGTQPCTLGTRERSERPLPCR